MNRMFARSAAGALAMSLLLGGCYGPFNMTRRLHRWNGEVSDNKWVVEGAFLLLLWVPAYSLATLGDALLFNSIEFWGGENPVQPPLAQAPQERRVVRGRAEAVLARRWGPEGESMSIDQFSNGRPAGSVKIQRMEDKTVALNEKGEVLFIAQARPEGGVVVKDTKNRKIAFYSADQVDRLLQDSSRQQDQSERQ